MQPVGGDGFVARVSPCPAASRDGAASSCPGLRTGCRLPAIKRVFRYRRSCLPGCFPVRVVLLSHHLPVSCCVPGLTIFPRYCGYRVGCAATAVNRGAYSRWREQSTTGEKLILRAMPSHPAGHIAPCCMSGHVRLAPATVWECACWASPPYGSASAIEPGTHFLHSPPCPPTTLTYSHPTHPHVFTWAHSHTNLTPNLPPSASTQKLQKELFQIRRFIELESLPR